LDISNEAIRNLFLFAPVFILSLSVHEWAHAWSAHKLGDSTAKSLGRLTLDPLAHISWIGTVIFPALAILTGAPFFGWAKPVPVDTRFFKKPRIGMAIVAAAGPISNVILSILLAITFGFIIRYVSSQPESETLIAQGTMLRSGLEMMRNAVQVNIFLALFNLMPFPPLDGSKILQGFVSPSLAHKIDEAAPNMQFLLLILMISGAFRVLAIPGFWFYGLLARLFM